MKKIVGLIALACVLLLGNAMGQSSHKTKTKASKEVKDTNYGKVVYLTTDQFKKVVYDYTANSKEWIYTGKLPCVIDFYADWCRPCRIVGPIMDSLAAEFAGRVIVYKVNVDKEKELSQVFGISSIPMVLFSPMKGQPASQPGALTRIQYTQLVKQICLG
ncbi:MAG: thioredoxin domain-containing protein, partial [Bacteroidales bacterium]